MCVLSNICCFMRSRAVNPRTPVTWSLGRGFGDASAPALHGQESSPGRQSSPGRGRPCRRREGSSILAFARENPVGVARECSSPRATPRYGLGCKSFLWLPVSRKWFEYPRPTGFFGARINSASPFKMQTWAWRSRLFQLPLLAKESRGRRSVRAARASLQSCSQPGCKRKNIPINS